ncbi:unnamed protein product [Brassicogethes aeneus]|uniref:Amino acid transporter transmembrane domain-containing protein n=1 Tax=Brassicogethes aeneus TaxID=1431903 RepID=A0A9P0BC62_BRAAE|nr:unnamed protein product [Brassicogethes aeneus]
MSKKTKAICLNNFSSTATLANNEVSVPLGSQDTLNEKDYDPYEHRNVLHPNTVAQVAKWCISLAVFFTFMLMFYVPIDITWRKISGHISEKRHNLSQFSLRTGIVIFATCIAIFAGEHLGPLIELVGAIFLSTLGLMVPAIMDTLINWDNLGCFYWKFWKNLVISIFGLFGAVAGSYYAILSMVNEES